MSERVETIVSDQKYGPVFSGFLLLAEKTRRNATVLVFAYASTQSVLYITGDECSGVAAGLTSSFVLSPADTEFGCLVC